MLRRLFPITCAALLAHLVWVCAAVGQIGQKKPGQKTAASKNKPIVTPTPQKPQVPLGQRTKSDAVARQMLKGVISPPLKAEFITKAMVYSMRPKEEMVPVRDMVSRGIDVASKLTGDTLSGREGAQTSMDLFIWTWLNARRDLGPDLPRPEDVPAIASRLTQFESRLSAIEQSTVKGWQGTLENLRVKHAAPIYIPFAIAFQDSFFVGNQWKKDFPGRALARFGALPKDVVAQWAEARGFDSDNTVFAAYELLAVEDLFLGDVFQQRVFDAALPIAQKLIAEKNAKK